MEKYSGEAQLQQTLNWGKIVRCMPPGGMFDAKTVDTVEDGVFGAG
jgi:hypothetical protein